ncbi:MAG: hypothetical protein A2Y15_05850 [Clostridiales bacterium GWF2_36_10]|nr:MAG: hypothetical protein A2Y15_05850 [Clostridiales bacterium GWF2_36_10]HAN21619.1 hypothetical protein [Clostridiales bacterium]
MFNILPLREQLPLKLRALYELYGYKKYRMDKFEPYDMYRENKSFLKYEGIITFTNPNGRLMALKPDVTMSIVKNAVNSAESNKLYYNENVFRMQSTNGEYSEINQMGLEFIGGDYNYSQAEVVLLALHSLEAIDSDYILNVAHMGFIGSLLDYAGITNGNREECLKLIKQKNTHEITEFANKNYIDSYKTEVIKAVVGISGDFETALKRLSSLALNANMISAAHELSELYKAMRASKLEKKLQLDFSIINDPDYYNGIVFQGYIPSTPRAVLSGGRYDNLLRRFGKQQNAIGFALYLGELDRALRSPVDYDTDVLLIYGDATPAQVISALESIKTSCECVRAEKEIPNSIKAKRIINIKEVIGNA